MKRIALGLTAVLVFTAVPAFAAVLSGTYRGRTSQGFKAGVYVKAGKVQFVSVPWSTNDCTPSDNYKISFPRFHYTNTAADPIGQSGNRFSERGTGTVDVGRGGKATYTTHVTGRFSRDRVAGLQSVTVRTRDKFGRHTCTSRVRWSARLQVG